MIQIAKQADRNIPVSLQQVARQGELPRRYLEQLVIGLKNASLIRGVSGKVGGYCLTKPAGGVKIGAIIEADHPAQIAINLHLRSDTMTTEKKIKENRIRIVKDDITPLEVDAFVFYASPDLHLGSGNGGAISMPRRPATQ